MNKVQYICWNYGKIRTSVTEGIQTVHLVRLADGRGLILTDAQMVKLGFAKWMN
jgi:hypothetical protein